MVLAQRFGGVADLALARQKDEDVALLDRAAHGVDGVEDRIGEVLFVFLLRIDVERAVAHLDRIQPPRDLDHRRTAKMLREALGVDGGGGDDELEVGPLRQQLPHVAEQEVDVEAALVGLVDDQRVVGGQEAVGLGLGEQDAVRHDLHVRVVADPVLEADLVTDHRAERGAEFLGHAGRHGARGDAARLGVADETRGAATDLEADLRDLRRLAGTGFATDDNDLMFRDCVSDVLAARRDRQLFGKGRFRQRREPCLAPGLRRGNLLRQRFDLLGRCAAPAIQLAQPAQKLAALAGDHAVERGTQRLDSGLIARLHEGGRPSTLRNGVWYWTARKRRQAIRRRSERRAQKKKKPARNRAGLGCYEAPLRPVCRRC